MPIALPTVQQLTAVSLGNVAPSSIMAQQQLIVQVQQLQLPAGAAVAGPATGTAILVRWLFTHILLCIRLTNSQIFLNFLFSNFVRKLGKFCLCVLCSLAVTYKKRQCLTTHQLPT